MTQPTRAELQTAAVKPEAGPSWLELAASRRERRGQAGLAARLAIYFFLIIVTAVGATAWILVQRSAAATTDGVQAIARSVARGVADAAYAPLQGADREQLDAIVSNAISPATDGAMARVQRVELFDKSGTLLAASGEVDRTNAPATSLTADSPIRQPIPLGPDLYVGGTVRVTVDTAGLNRSYSVMYQAFGALAIGVIAAALLVVRLFVRQSLRPLDQLANLMRRVVDDGDLSATIPARGGNKAVFKLSVAFNQLVAFARHEREQTTLERAKMAAAIKELEAKVASNTAQLEAANGRLQSEIAEKEDFLRAVSHDLNAPLRNIGGMVAMLMMKDKASLSPEVINRLERIKKNVDVETDLINELLELSRIKTRRQTLEVVDTESIVWDLRGLFENDLKTRHIEITLETSLPTLYAERARVRQVFLNLIDNAIKYMGDDKPRREIRIGCRVSVTEAEFYVADTGLGIHPDDIDKVFCVFRRGRGEVAQKVPGKGVGLASVKSIVETYAGRIWVTSTLGQGTTFHFAINGKYVPSVSAQLPDELKVNGATSDDSPALAA